MGNQLERVSGNTVEYVVVPLVWFLFDFVPV